MTFHLTPITPSEARLVCDWRFGPGYGMCDLGPGDVAPMLLPRYGYHTVRRDGQMVGFACFGEDAQVYGGVYDAPGLDFGCGLDPALCGQGMGLHFVSAIIEFAGETFDPPLLRLTVACSNLRAITVYERSGFLRRRRFAGITRGGVHPFLLMTRKI